VIIIAKDIRENVKKNAKTERITALVFQFFFTYFFKKNCTYKANTLLEVDKFHAKRNIKVTIDTTVEIY